jgi:hypothetical protein
MLKWLYDLFFTRSEWRIINTLYVYGHSSDRPCCTTYVLQNQWGKIKKKTIWP